jgi:hypothetical protein
MRMVGPIHDSVYARPPPLLLRQILAESPREYETLTFTTRRPKRACDHRNPLDNGFCFVENLVGA